MDTVLKEVLEYVNSWLKFAESKNAALIAFNGAAGFGFAAAMAEGWGVIPLAVCIYGSLCVGLLGIGASIGLLSFLPRIRLPWTLQEEVFDARDNLLFFGHAARHTPGSYLEALSECAGTNDKEFTPLQKAYAEQIVVNSRISVHKYRYFRLGLWFTLSALLTPVAPAIALTVHLINRRQSR